MTTILCATDASPSSARVVATAAAMSRLYDADLELFHAVAIPPSYPPEVTDEQMVAELRDAAEAAVSAQAAAARGGGARVRTRVQLGGPDAIVDRARETQAGLLVLGTHARHGAARLLLGSVAERTLRAAPCPTLVVPPAATGALVGQAKPARLKVVAGIDFSPASDAALAWLGALRARVDCDIRLIHLFVPAVEHDRLGLEPPLPFEVNPEVVEALARELRPRIHARAGTDFALRIRPLWGGEDDPLAWEADTDDADLLVIGTSQTRRSTALRTVRGARVPVVCVPRDETTAVRTEPLLPITTILVPTDFSAGAAAAVRTAYRLLLPTGGDVVLTHIAPPDELGLEPSRQEEIESCLLGLIPEELALPHVHLRTLVVADPSPGEAIVKAVRRVGADLVVMAGGMIADHVLRNAGQPVMVVPAGRTARAKAAG
ncbi:MAG TPA: universal stress protein [Polyangia bacterium]|nr:universal stress protein [Polyangia bacterium]